MNEQQNGTPTPQIVGQVIISVTDQGQVTRSVSGTFPMGPMVVQLEIIKAYFIQNMMAEEQAQEAKKHRSSILDPHGMPVPKAF